MITQIVTYPSMEEIKLAKSTAEEIVNGNIKVEDILTKNIVFKNSILVFIMELREEIIIQLELYNNYIDSKYSKKEQVNDVILEQLKSNAEKALEILDPESKKRDQYTKASQIVNFFNTIKNRLIFNDSNCDEDIIDLIECDKKEYIDVFSN